MNVRRGQVLTDFVPNVAYPLIGLTGFVELSALAWWGIELWRTINLSKQGRRSSPIRLHCVPTDSPAPKL